MGSSPIEPNSIGNFGFAILIKLFLHDSVMFVLIEKICILKWKDSLSLNAGSEVCNWV